MATEIVPLTAEHLGDLQDLLLPFWQRKWDPAYAEAMFRWRFLDRPDWQALIAYDRKRPVGFLDAFVRTRYLDSRPVRVLETADWFTLPDYRPITGIMLMRQMMRKSMPILVAGSNEHTHGLLPKLGWQELTPLALFILPVRLGAAVKRLSRTVHFPLTKIPGGVADAMSVRIASPKTELTPSGQLSVAKLEHGQAIPEIASLPGRTALSAELTTREAEWLSRAPKPMGEFLWLVFSVDGNPAGITLSRVYYEGPFRKANLLHVQAGAPSASLYDWMVAETARQLIERGVHWIVGRFGCSVAVEACRRVGFRQRVGPVRVFWWDEKHKLPKVPLDVTWVCGDDSLHPLPN